MKQFVYIDKVSNLPLEIFDFVAKQPCHFTFKYKQNDDICNYTSTLQSGGLWISVTYVNAHLYTSITTDHIKIYSSYEEAIVDNIK